MPRDLTPTLLADRGLSWPLVADLCQKHHWHFVLRVQRQTRVRLDDGRIISMGDLAACRGTMWMGTAEVFRKARWRRVNIVARWPHDTDEPWLLISDLKPTAHLCQRYRKRMRQEQSFRDEKSHGFRWTESRVREPTHATRLLLIMAIAMTWLIVLGLRIIEAGRRQELERADRRTLSVFQLGLRFLQRLLLTGQSPPAPKSVGW